MKMALMVLAVAGVMLSTDGVLTGQEMPGALDIPLDITPARLNAGNWGLVPAVILGTGDFDVSAIDMESVLLEGVPPVRWYKEDVAGRMLDTGTGEEQIGAGESPDGSDDLTLKFRRSEVVAALGPIADGDVRSLTLSGRLRDGTSILGVDEVTIVKRPPDFDGDGSLGFSDLQAFARRFGAERGDGNYDPIFDLDDDGKVGFNDFVLFALSFVDSPDESGSLAKPMTDLFVGAGATGTLHLVVSEGNDPQERIVTVRLNQALEVQGYSLSILYDPGLLELVGVDGPSGSVFAAEIGVEGVPLQISVAPGKMLVADVLRPGRALNGDVDLIRLTFRRLNEAATGSVEVTEALITDGWGQVETVDATRLGDLRLVPDQYVLLQNHPNPFNPSTQIEYRVPEAGEVSLVVYSVLGQPIRALIHGEHVAGTYRVSWDGSDADGSPVSSGVYFYHLTARAFTQTRTMMLVK